jgi:hypothetical protein
MYGRKNEGRAPAADFAFGVLEPQPATRGSAAVPRSNTAAPSSNAAAPRSNAAARSGSHAAALRNHAAVPSSGALAARRRVATALADAGFAQLSVVDEKPGFDPYNSGSFDRSHSWARTHRR